MRLPTQISLPFVTAILLFIAVFAVPLLAQAQSEELDSLYEQLQSPVDGNWQAVEKRIEKLWAQSGSDAMDLLLERGLNAIETRDYVKAIEHLTALTDHAPEFAEGWNARATAYFQMEAFGPAIADIRTTLSLNPRHYGAMTGLGLIFEYLGQHQNALRAFRAAGAVHPHQPDIIEAIKRLEEKTAGKSL